MDAIPRVTARIVDHMSGRGEAAPSRYSLFLGIQFAGVTFILLFLMGSFGTFIAFATSAGFITAPAIAYYNYRAVKSPEVAAHYVPSQGLVAWHWTGFTAMAIFAVAFLVERLT